MKVVFDYSKLRGRIIEKYHTCGKFAEALGWKKSYLSAKLVGKIAFTQEDVFRFCDMLDIATEEAGAYFFCPKSLEN